MPTLETVKKVSKQDIKIARKSAPLFYEKMGAKGVVLTVIINGQELTLPVSLQPVLGSCLAHIAAGRSVAVVPEEGEIGTQEAANMLGVSRPYLVKLLDSKTIPSRKVGAHRRVRVEDIRAYQEREKAARRKVLAELAAEDQRLDLGECPPGRSLCGDVPSGQVNSTRSFTCQDHRNDVPQHECQSLLRRQQAA